MPMRRRSGLSLPEVMLALMVVGLAYLPLAELYRITTTQTVKSRNVLTANYLTQCLFEVYRLRPNDLLTVLAGGAGGVRTDDLLKDTGWRQRLTGGAREIEDLLTGSSYRMEVAVKLADPAISGLDRVDVTMHWKESGSDRSRRYARLVSR